MSTQGTTVIDFGAFPGTPNISVDVSSPSITAGVLVDAWILPDTTTDHSIDEHIADPPKVYAGNVQAGVGFTIYAYYNKDTGSSSASSCYGTWNVAWVWN